MFRNASVLVVCALAIVLGGCRKAPKPVIVEAEGVVLLDGKPVNKAMVRFVPTMRAGPEYIAMGVTDESGHFYLSCKGQYGACVGDSHVVVMEAALPSELKGEDKGPRVGEYFRSLGARPLPPQYANVVSTPLVFEVSAEQKVYTIELSR